MGRCLNKLVLLICALLMQFVGAQMASSSSAAADATTAITLADASTSATARSELDKVGDDAT